MKRRFMMFFLTGTITLVIACALAIPFVFESQTLWYKVGVDKTLLRAGHLIGLLALVSLMAQILLGTRGKYLEETFGVAAIVAWHRANGVLLCCLAALHVSLVLIPEGIANLPIGIKHWPEMVGGLLFLGLLSQAVTSLYRQKFCFNYKTWRMIHRVVGYLALCLAVVHVVFIADSFAQGIPRMALFVVFVIVLTVVGIVKLSVIVEKNRS